MGYPDELRPRRHRIDALDTLRGVAVLGILVMNVYAFAMPWVAYANPLAAGGSDALNVGVWYATHILFDQKFISIFSLLFGAGIALMADRADAAGVDFGPVFFRRQAVLLLVGLGHAYLLWFGDILFFYAVVGTLAWFVRRLPPSRLLVVACLMLPVAPLINSAAGSYLAELESRVATIEQRLEAGEDIGEDDEALLDEWAAARPVIAPSADDTAKDLAAYRGDYGGIVRHRAPFVAAVHQEGLLFFALWRIGGLMLLGMVAFRLGYLSADRSAACYAKTIAVGYGLGLPLCAFSAFDLAAHGFDPLYVMRIGGLSNYVGSLFVALGHAGLVLYAVRRGWHARLARRLAAVGRLALTNYLLQSVVMTTVFYGYGLGLYGSLDRAPQMLLVALVLAAQLWLSPRWLARFRFGPAEWLWRSLSYGRLQPMRR